MIRPAVFAGRFYPGRQGECERMAADLLQGTGASVAPAIGAVVPHAGWIYSGATAALGLASITAAKPDTVVIFGAVHNPDLNPASVWVDGAWETPLGPLEVDAELAERVLRDDVIVADPDAHRYEHAIEVQLPLLKRLAPGVRIVPISVRPGAQAVEIGAFCATQLRNTGRRVGFVASSDLTHYGPAFRFESHGHGAAGVRWAKEVNDRRMIALIAAMQADKVVAEAEDHHNACGPGAIAALLGAMQRCGALEFHELQHTCSAEVKLEADPDPANSVGYVAAAFSTT